MKTFLINDTTGRGFTSEKMGEGELISFAEDFDDLESIIYFSRTSEIGESLSSEGCRITRGQDRPDLGESIIHFLKSCEMETLPASEHYSFDSGNYTVTMSDGSHCCIIGNREVKSKNLLHVVAELLEFIQTGEEK